MNMHRPWPRQHPRTRATTARLRHGLTKINKLARPVLGVAPLDRCQLVQYFPSLAARGFREAVIQVGTAPLRGQQFAKPAGLLVTHHGFFVVVTPRADGITTPAGRPANSFETTPHFSGIIPD
jgi:hypothetical protein